MAFSYTITKQTIYGDTKVVIGTYVNAGGSTGGAIATGLNRVFSVSFGATGDAVDEALPSVNATHPYPGTFTIVTTADRSGTFVAIGE